MLTNTQIQTIETSTNLEQVNELIQSEGGVINGSIELILNRWKHYPDTDIPELLLKSGINVNDVDINGNSLLMYSCGLNKSDYLSANDFFFLFLNAGADINYISPDELSAIDVAARAGNAMCVNQLLQRGATINEKTLKYALPTNDEQYNYHRYLIARELLEELYEQGINVDIPEIYAAALLGNSEKVIRLMDSSIQVNSDCLLICIASFCDEATVDAALKCFEKTTNINTLSPLLFAASQYNNTDVISHIFDKYAHLIDDSVLHARVLENSLINGSTDVATYLLKQNVSLDVPSQQLSFDSVFERLSEVGQWRSAEVLLSNGFVPSEYSLWLSLCNAAQNGNIDYLDYLLSETNADINSGIESGMTAISTAAQYGHMETVIWLSEHGALCDGIVSPLGCAVASNSLEIVKYLYDVCNADINGLIAYPDGSGSCALEEAIQYGYLDILRYLVSNGANLDVEIEIFASDFQSKKIVNIREFASQNESQNVINYLSEYS